MKIKYITQGAMLASIAAIVQLIPIFTSEIFSVVTILSTVPIYISSRRGVKVGINSYLVTALIILIFSKDDSLIFLLTNGLVGLLLGITEMAFNQKGVSIILTSVTLTGALLVGEHLIGCSILGLTFDTIIIELLIVLLLSTLYITIIYCLLSFLENQFKRIIK